MNHDLMSGEEIIYVVDDDQAVREGLADLLSSEGLKALTFSSACEYIGFARPNAPGCLLLDIELPDISGLELQRRLADEAHPRIVFLTGHGDVPSTARAFKAGAVDFLTKPFQPPQLLAAVAEAVRLDRARRDAAAALSSLRERFNTLTPREREVLPLVVSGLLNKQAAAVLGISEITVQIHRANIMRKLAADSLPTLVRYADSLGVQVTHSRRAPS